MKIRNGFVSNSSSSSYLISLPKNFDIKKILSEKNLNRIKAKNSEWDLEIECLENNKTLKEDLEYLLEKGFVISVDGEGNKGDKVCFESLSLLLDDYVIGNIEGGADQASGIVLVDKSRSTGIRLSKIKPLKKEEKVLPDPNYNSKDYPNETRMLKLDEKIPKPRFVKVRPKSQKLVTRIINNVAR